MALVAAGAVYLFDQTARKLAGPSFDGGQVKNMNELLAFEVSPFAAKFLSFIAAQTIAAGATMDSAAAKLLSDWNKQEGVRWTHEPLAFNHVCTIVGCIPGGGQGNLYNIKTDTGTSIDGKEIKTVNNQDGIRARYVLSIRES